MPDLAQNLHPPSRRLPVVIFGAGSIVRDAHLPACAQGGYAVAGLYDPDLPKAQALAAAHGTRAFGSVSAAVAAGTGAVYDLAVPPAALPGILTALPEGAVVLMQKPMGSDLAAADQILAICRARHLRAAVNFQLRFAPMVLALKDAIARGLLGDLVDFEARITVDTPWQTWAFLAGLPRVEILLHSIHYLDLMRDLLGNPLGVHAKTLGHPSSQVSNTRSAILPDYGPGIRALLGLDHNHAFGRRFQTSEIRLAGTRGAAVLKLGVNLNYPAGEPDELWLNPGKGWRQVPLSGNWFPAAFTGRMTQVQRFAAGDDPLLLGSAEDAWHTMALVEAAYASSAAPAHPIRKAPDA